MTLSRLREFLREPEALFWAFGFPILISVAMAIAFPSREAASVLVGIDAGPAGAPLRQALDGVDGIAVHELPADGQERALRDGDVHVLVTGTDPPTYRFDPARDESRVARLVVDDALKRAAGRIEPWTAREEPVSRLVASVRDAIRQWSDGRPIHDDLTLLALRRVSEAPPLDARSVEAVSVEPAASYPPSPG